MTRKSYTVKKDLSPIACAKGISVKLSGTKCNRTAIGARVRVVTGKHPQINEVHSRTNVMSQSDLRLHFGLGQATQIDMIEVKCPPRRRWSGSPI